MARLMKTMSGLGSPISDREPIEILILILILILALILILILAAHIHH